MMQAPLFPVPLDIFAAKTKFRDFAAGEELHPHPGITIRTGPLNHPGGATGYRVEYGGKAAAYITDTEHRPGHPDQNVLRLVDRADLMIYDATYTDEEYPSHHDWGHSTWQEAVRLAEAAQVKTLAIFHHDPDHDDNCIDNVVREARNYYAKVRGAAEGMELTL